MIDNIVYLDDVVGRRIDPHQFHPERIAIIERIKKQSWCKLNDVIKNVKTITSSVPKGETYIGLENIESNTGIYTPSDIETISSAAKFKKGDILFPKLRPYLNKVHLAQFDGYCSTEFMIFEANNILPDFLTIVLRSNIVVAQTKHLMTGNTHPRLQPEDIANLLIPYPNIEKQKEIIEIYCNGERKRNNYNNHAKEKLNRINDFIVTELGVSFCLKNNDSIYKTRMTTIVGGRFDVKYNRQNENAELFESTFDIIPLNKYVDDIFQGIGKSETTENTYTLLKVKNILKGNLIDYENVEFIKKVPAKKILHKNDIITPFIGEAIRQIKFSVFDKEDSTYTVDNNTGVIRLKQNINAYYVCEFLCSTLGACQIENIIGGGGVPFLGTSGAKMLKIIVPPIDIQNNLADNISNYRQEAQSYIERGKSLMDEIAKKIENRLFE